MCAQVVQTHNKTYAGILPLFHFFVIYLFVTSVENGFQIFSLLIWNKKRKKMALEVKFTNKVIEKFLSVASKRFWPATQNI